MDGWETEGYARRVGLGLARRSFQRQGGKEMGKNMFLCLSTLVRCRRANSVLEWEEARASPQRGTC